MATKTYPKNSGRFVGRFLRDPLVGESEKGRYRVMGRIVVNDSYTDHRGDQQTRKAYVDLKIFDQDIARKISEAQPKENTMIAVGGYMGFREDKVTDRDTGEVKTYHGMEVTVDGSNSDHYAEIVTA